MIKEEIKKIPDEEIYTEVFSEIEIREIEEFQYKVYNHMLRNKFFEEVKILGKYNCPLDDTRFQKSHHEISKDWIKETKEGKKTWYLPMLGMKLVAKGMAISLMSEMIKNEDEKVGVGTEEDIEK